MAREEIPKRSLSFENFQSLMEEANRLNEKGYESHGNWTLGQSCGHVAEWLRYPMDGFPVPPIFLRPIFWVMKVTMAKSMAKKILNEGFKGGMPTAPESVPKAEDLSDADGIAKLEEVVDRVEKFQGELLPSPLFGEMDRETWIKVGLLHAAHHLGYLEPKA